MASPLNPFSVMTAQHPESYSFQCLFALQNALLVLYLIRRGIFSSWSSSKQFLCFVHLAIFSVPFSQAMFYASRSSSETLFFYFFSYHLEEFPVLRFTFGNVCCWLCNKYGLLRDCATLSIFSFYSFIYILILPAVVHAISTTLANIFHNAFPHTLFSISSSSRQRFPLFRFVL